jgi:hypothetical protein
MSILGHCIIYLHIYIRIYFDIVNKVAVFIACCRLNVALLHKLLKTK